MHYKASFLIILLAVAGCFVCVSDESDAGDVVSVLIDEGNGSFHWEEVDGPGSVIGMLEAAASSVGMELTGKDGVITVDGLTERTIGSASTGGTVEVSGTTGDTVKSCWNVYSWDGTAWIPAEDLSAVSPEAIAVIFAPEGVVPVSNPDDKQAWTMYRGDSLNSSSKEVRSFATGDIEYPWSEDGAAHAGLLYAHGMVIQKFGIDMGTGYARVVALDAATGEVVTCSDGSPWDFRFLSGANYESSTPVIVGDSVYVATMTGFIYRIPLDDGPGQDYCNVTSFGGVPYTEAEKVPSVIKKFDVGTTYDSAFTTMVCWSGALYMAHSNGMVYCYDLGLNLVWSYQMEGSAYLTSPTVTDGCVYMGCLNGHLYILDAATGEEIADELVYQVQYGSKNVKLYGNVGQVAVVDDAVIFSVSDGLGMSQMNSGLACYQFDKTTGILVQRFFSTDLGILGRFVTPVDTDDFQGAYMVISDGIATSLCRISTAGEFETVLGGLPEIHSPMLLVNDESLFAVCYNSLDGIYMISLDGKIEGVAKCSPSVRNFNMIPLLVMDGFVLGGTDAGIYRLDGAFEGYVPETKQEGSPVIIILAEIVGGILLALGAIYCYLKFVKGIDAPFSYLRKSFRHYLYGDDISHNTRSRHRLKFVLLIGTILVFLSFTLSLCCGSNGVVDPVTAFSSLFSAISKDGNGLTVLETSIFESRLPRAIAAMAVGIGLSVAGCMYQAMIRNPLVDPYIMGVSSGAAIAAIAVIAFDFTLFGLFPPHSAFLIVFSAMIGGIAAFLCTMFLAERAGGQSINYVLAGVVVGLALSAVQTLMLTMAGNKLSNALSWLYGSFAQITWPQVGILFFLALFLSLVPLIWAKEFNLVLLGEDQARQMGLDVKRFNRLMLILASVLTAVCVAFVGVIGFVGLVIPHLCRMLLGSDHRMVLPSSICFGAVMLMLADLLARTGYYGMELPVGAITTIIGIPVFAYLLIKKGRMYDG